MIALKKDILFPLSRNKYFFGKLLTQRDMEAEQTYFNNKRRLLNAVLCGCGVVCGMNVVKVDGMTIDVESGIAIDGRGRELVLPQTVHVRLHDLDGFDGDYGALRHVYLCAEYFEELTEPMHALASPALEDDHFGRVSEGVKLYLRYGEPDDDEIGRAAAEAVSADTLRTEPLERKLERGEKLRLYLAKIHITRLDEVYEIEEIEQLPFKQNAAGYGSNAVRTSGAATVEIPPASRKGSLHCSQEITHGLGSLGVNITLCLQSDNGVIFGSPAVFSENEYYWAAKTDNAKGAFQIGVRLRANSPARILSFMWIAEVL